MGCSGYKSFYTIIPQNHPKENSILLIDEKRGVFLYNTISNIIVQINSLLWGNFTVLLIFSAAIFLTVRTGFVQFRHPLKLLRFTLLAGKKENSDSSKGVSRLQALSTALGASMGTGNIIGVATAISIGGCGAVFWMVVSAFFVMGFAFTENVLGVSIIII